MEAAQRSDNFMVKTASKSLKLQGFSTIYM